MISRKNIILKLIPITLIIFLIVLNFFLPQAVNVIVSPSNKTVYQGQSFYVNISIDPQGASISGAQIDITFNQSLLQLNNVTEGDIFKQNGASTYFNNGTISNIAGTAGKIFGLIIGPGNISAPGTFIRLNFTVIGQSGISEIMLSKVLISYPDASAAPFTTTNASIVINSAPVIIENNITEIVVMPSSKTVISGQDFTLDLSIDPKGSGIAGVQLDLAVNKSILRINSITEGNLFKQGGSSTIFNSGVIDNTEGTAASIYAAIIGQSDVTTQGTFITINATAIGTPGISRIDLSDILITDKLGDPLAYNVTNGSINIYSPPVLAPINSRTVNEGALLSFNLTASGNGGILSYSALNMPSGATFDPTTKMFVWTPTYYQSGTYQNVRFEVTDGIQMDSENITITVNNINMPPTLTVIPSNGSKFNETDIISISAIASDPDNDTLYYSIKIDGKQVSTSPAYNWATTYSSSGNHEINVSVSDGTEVVSKMVQVHINNAYPRYDVNENGRVEVGDLAIIGQHFNERVTPPYPRYDVNMDGRVNIADLVIAGQHMGEETI